MSWVFVGREEEAKGEAEPEEDSWLLVETAGPPSRGYESVAEQRG